MSRKPSTAALDSFRHSSFPIRRRAPRHPAGEALRLSSGHGFSRAATVAYSIRLQPLRAAFSTFHGISSSTDKLCVAPFRNSIIQEEAMNVTPTNRPTHNAQLISSALLRVTLALLLVLLGIASASPAHAQIKTNRFVKTYPLNRANAENLQRWVNAGHDTWCRDPKLVAAHTLDQFAPGIADSSYELASQPVVRKLSNGRTATYTYHSLDGQTTYRVTLRRPQWLRPTAGSLNKTVWLPTRLEIVPNATT